MAKSFSSVHEANNALSDLAMNERVEICGQFFRVSIGFGGKCLKRIKEQQFVETKIEGEREFKSSGNLLKSSKSWG